ncbi:MAG: class I SAM-dependent methyltransferase [Gemmataceae bacterium]|nr:class I SAM-dependent methyltransferase [Gemmataceae bacterium]
MSRARLHNERQFHDQQAAQRARALRPPDYEFSDNSYLNHESWIAPAFDALGDLRNQRVLDLGCGHGMASVVLARRGARVTACDLSLGYLREAQARAAVNRVRAHFSVCDGERLPFADGSFDRIWGNAILHHFDLRRAAREIDRVLAPGGIAVFCEPWAGNRWLSWARRGLPYPGKERTADETPLGQDDLDQLRAVFPSLQVRGYQLLSMLGRVVRQRHLVSSLAWFDEVLIRHCPRWQRYCRYVVVCLRKTAHKNSTPNASGCL